MQTAPMLTTIKLANNDEIYLLGTAHVSAKSVEDVRTVAQDKAVDAICIEIDSERLNSLKERKKWRETDLITILKNKQGGLLLANLALSSFQKRMGEEQGVAPGSEMKEAVLIAEQMDIIPALVDRKVSITLRRAWRLSSFWQKINLISSLVLGSEGKNISAQEIEKLKQQDLLSQMMQELGKEFPSIKTVLIDERDTYLAHHIYHTPGTKRLAVVGAGHIEGIIARIQQLEAGEKFDMAQLEEIPAPSLLSKAAPYLISLAIIGLIVFAFINQSSKQQSIEVIELWILSNSLPVIIGAILALAHPITIIIAALVAPITAFIPAISAGLVAGIVQATLRKPRAKDFEDILMDFGKKHFYKNRVLKILLTFLLVNLTGFLGTIWGIARVANKI